MTLLHYVLTFPRLIYKTQKCFLNQTGPNNTPGPIFFNRDVNWKVIGCANSRIGTSSE